MKFFLAQMVEFFGFSKLILPLAMIITPFHTNQSWNDSLLLYAFSIQFTMNINFHAKFKIKIHFISTNLHDRKSEPEIQFLELFSPNFDSLSHDQKLILHKNWVLRNMFVLRIHEKCMESRNTWMAYLYLYFFHEVMCKMIFSCNTLVILFLTQPFK